MHPAQGEGWIPPRSPTTQPENPGFRVIFGWPRSDPPRGEASRHPWSPGRFAPKEVRPYLVRCLDARIVHRVGYRPDSPSLPKARASSRRALGGPVPGVSTKGRRISADRHRHPGHQSRRSGVHCSQSRWAARLAGLNCYGRSSRVQQRAKNGRLTGDAPRRLLPMALRPAEHGRGWPMVGGRPTVVVTGPTCSTSAADPSHDAVNPRAAAFGVLPLGGRRPSPGPKLLVVQAGSGGPSLESGAKRWSGPDHHPSAAVGGPSWRRGSLTWKCGLGTAVLNTWRTG